MNPFKMLLLFMAICCACAYCLTILKSVKCTVLDPVTIKLNYCYIKSYSRTCAFLNVGVELEKKLDAPAYVNIF